MKTTIELFKTASFTADEAGTLTLTPDADPRETSLDGIHTVQLQFPAFTDGRAFSQAYLLRRRLGYTGRIRAIGDVLIDQLVQMQRSGFTQAVLRDDQNFQHGSLLLTQYDGCYQGDAVNTRPRFAVTARQEQTT